MAISSKREELANVLSRTSANGKSTRKSKALPARKKPIRYFASAFPTPGCGKPIPDEFALLVKRLEVLIKAPIWLMMHNGDSDFCCAHICVHTMLGFQNDRSQIGQGQPAALLIDSPGGSAHYAYTIARFFQRRASQFKVVVPRYAKSAATLLALGASELFLGQDAELGPLDVQMRDREREETGSALDAVQSLERLNVFSMAAVDQLMLLLTERTGKKTDTILPLVLNYAATFVRPILEKIDTVDYTKKSRELKVAEEYAVRLMQKNYHTKAAKQIAAHLVERYPTHGFVIDAQEAQSQPNEAYGLGLKVAATTPEMEEIFTRMQPHLDSLSIVGRLVQVEI